MALPAREDGGAHDRHEARAPAAPPARNTCSPRSTSRSSRISGPSAPSCDGPARRCTRSPNALAPHYSRFRVAERLLLTGHSHQAWPDCGFEAQSAGVARRCRSMSTTSGTTPSSAPSGCARVHPAARRCGRRDRARARTRTSWSCGCCRRCPCATRPRLVTTDGEFHTIRRQLDRLAEEGLEVVRVAEQPVETVAERLAAAVDDRTALVLVSAVFFDTGRIARGLGEVAASCRRHGAPLLVDAYHALNVVPVLARRRGPERRLRRRRRLQVLPAGRGQLLPAPAAGHRGCGRW